MNASMKSRCERATFDLIRLSTVRLIDDSRTRLAVPLRLTLATATIAECLMAKGLEVRTHA